MAVNPLRAGGRAGSPILGEPLDQLRPGRGRSQASWVGFGVAAIAALWTLGHSHTSGAVTTLIFPAKSFAQVTGSRPLSQTEV